MTLSFLIQQLKGGSGSGNFGHSGRPGKKGGSVGGTGLGGSSNAAVDKLSNLKSHAASMRDVTKVDAWQSNHMAVQDAMTDLGFNLKPVDKQGFGGRSDKTGNHKAEVESVFDKAAGWLKLDSSDRITTYHNTATWPEIRADVGYSPKEDFTYVSTSNWQTS